MNFSTLSRTALLLLALVLLVPGSQLLTAQGNGAIVPKDLSPDSHFSFDSANHRVASDAFIYAGWKALKALRRSTPNG